MPSNWLGDVEHLDSFDATIDRDSASQLRDYFRLGGLARFERSPMGDMLSNADTFSANVAPCLYCGGVRDKENPGNDRGGIGFLGDTSTWTDKMHARIRKAAAALGDMELKVESGCTCPVCRGKGWVTTGRIASGEITARPSLTASHGAERGGNTDVEIGTCAKVEAILDKADVLFQLTTSVLCCKFMDGALGSIAVWHLTPSGKTLLRRNAKDTEFVLFFMQLRGANSEQKNKTMAKQLTAADQQAKLLIEYAGKAWNAAIFVDRCGL